MNKQERLLQNNLNRLSDDELLSKRLCDLHLKIEGAEIAKCVEELYKELDNKGILFHPECYLADEWLAPDGEPVIGIPFYLAHPRIKKLEKKFMLDVEGGTRKYCMMLLRHEAGHAINYAYKLYRRKKWRELFGPFATDYPDKYRYKPFSKCFVQHLDEWYAQYHPDEDFAETFAVWLTPNKNWRKRYKGWKALDKLEYVEKLMGEISKKKPLKSHGQKMWIASKSKMSLKTYYRKKRKFYAEDFPDFHDLRLKKIFGKEIAPSKKLQAARFLSQYRKAVLNSVALKTGEKKYIINKLLRDLIDRSRELKLYVFHSEIDTIIRITSYVTTLIMNYLYTGSFERKKE